MKRLNFTVYNEDNTIHCYLFEVTREEAQAYVKRLNRNTKSYHYFMDGYREV